jgi:aldose 1-epimerase
MDCVFYGRTGAGAEVHAYTFRGGRGVSATVLDLGGTITAINVADRQGKTRNVVLGLRDAGAYEASGRFNCLIGRYANRLKNGFVVDGTHYAPPKDANGVTLHGGRDLSYGSRIWAVTEANASALTLRLVSPDGDQGFPGNLDIAVTYSLDENGDFRIDYRAVTDRPTIINLTNHLYLSLAASGTVERQLLQLFADRFTPTDAHQIPTGEIAPLADTALDFRAPVTIGARLRASEPQMLIARGYDHNFVLRKSRGDALEVAACLHDPNGGIMLTLSTTEPGLQVYSTNNVNGSLIGAAGTTIRQSDGLALETQHFPDSPNHANFPSTELRPGEMFASTTVLRFSAQ